MKKMTPERAAEIVNDIHEDCCKASKKELMECCSYLSIRNAVLYSEVNSAYTSIAFHAFEAMREFKKKHYNK
jgi:hypothetical protein